MYTPVKLTLSGGEETYSSYADLSQAKTDADDAVTDFFNGGAGDAFADSAAIAKEIGTPANSGTGDPATGLIKLLGDAQAVEDAVTNFFNGGAGDGFADSAAIDTEIGTAANSGTGAPATGLIKLLGDAQALEGAETAFFNGGAGDAFADSAAIATRIGTPANSDTGAPATGLTKLLGDAQALEGALNKAKGDVDSFFVNSPFATKSAISSELSSLKSVDLDASYSSVTVALSDGDVTFGTYADLLSGSESAQDDRDAFFGTGVQGMDFANSAAIGAQALSLENLGKQFDSLEAAVVTAQGNADTFFNGLTGADAAFDTAAKIATEIGTPAKQIRALPATGLMAASG